jgi:hypothetical protein
MFEMSINNPQALHNAYTYQTCIKMSFSAKLDILAFIPHIFILDNFGCQQHSLKENRLTSSMPLYSSVLRNITVLYSSLPTPWKITLTEERRDPIFVSYVAIYSSVNQ